MNDKNEHFRLSWRRFYERLEEMANNGKKSLTIEEVKDSMIKSLIEEG